MSSKLSNDRLNDDRETEIEKYKRHLLMVLCKQPDKKYQMGNRNSPVWQRYALAGKEGKRLYSSFSDEELLQFLRDTASELDHTPSQKEVFWVMREYIKRRFGKWPYALRLAGLSTSAGKCGTPMEEQRRAEAHKSALLAQVHEEALRLGRLPHPEDLPQVCSQLRKHYKLWSDVLRAAGVSAQMLDEKSVYEITDLEPEYLDMLEEVKACAHKLGRSPAHGEIDAQLKRALIGRCGSWRNALFQIGLLPLAAKKPFQNVYLNHRKAENRREHTEGSSDYLYRVLDLPGADRALLEELRAMHQKTGRPPLPEDVPEESRRRLHKVCGSWVNVLYQIGIRPEDYYKTLDEGSEEKTHGK